MKRTIYNSSNRKSYFQTDFESFKELFDRLQVNYEIQLDDENNMIYIVINGNSENSILNNSNGELEIIFNSDKSFNSFNFINKEESVPFNINDCIAFNDWINNASNSSEVVVCLLYKFMQNKNNWMGFATELYQELHKLLKSLNINKANIEIPKSVRSLGTKIRQNIESLNNVGIKVEIKICNNKTQYNFINLNKNYNNNQTIITKINNEIDNPEEIITESDNKIDTPSKKSNIVFISNKNNASTKEFNDYYVFNKLLTTSEIKSKILTKYEISFSVNDSRNIILEKLYDYYFELDEDHTTEFLDYIANLVKEIHPPINPNIIIKIIPHRKNTNPKFIYEIELMPILQLKDTLNKYHIEFGEFSPKCELQNMLYECKEYLKDILCDEEDEADNEESSVEDIIESYSYCKSRNCDNELRKFNDYLVFDFLDSMLINELLERHSIRFNLSCSRFILIKRLYKLYLTSDTKKILNEIETLVKEKYPFKYKGISYTDISIIPHRKTNNPIYVMQVESMKKNEIKEVLRDFNINYDDGLPKCEYVNLIYEKCKDYYKGMINCDKGDIIKVGGGNN